MRINIDCATNLTVTYVVAAQLDCDIIKVWKGWFPFIVIGNICFSHTNYKSGLGTRSFFCASWKTVYKWLRNTAGASILGMYRKETL